MDPWKPVGRPSRRTDAVIGALGAGVFAALALRARRHVDRDDAEATVRVNRTGGELGILRVPQQLGTPWTLLVLAGVGAVRRQWELALAAGLALPVEKGLEVLAKKTTARKRPAEVVSDEVRLRDDAPDDGPTFPSGHAAIAVAAAYLALPRVPAVALPVVATAVGTCALTRVHQGAHFVSDAAGGVALGLGAAALLRSAVTGTHVTGTHLP